MSGTIRAVACCYRLATDGPEFLLVRTRSGRWTVPGGRVDPGESPAAAAAREAREEAGVAGALDPVPVAWVGVRKCARELFGGAARTPVFALEVEHEGTPDEAWRHPTWMSAGDSELALRRAGPWSPRWRVVAVRATMERLDPPLSADHAKRALLE